MKRKDPSTCEVSIHAPREGCDPRSGISMRCPCWFQSTHPVRGATLSDAISACTRHAFQSTHPVRGATRCFSSPHSSTKVSIHAPREGCDEGGMSNYIAEIMFQSTHPVRGATYPIYDEKHREELFQSTHPVRGATETAAYRARGLRVSIHAPREGCDQRILPTPRIRGRFQSTHPVRGATNRWQIKSQPRWFQSTHPVRGATSMAVISAATVSRFQSTHPVRGATDPWLLLNVQQKFQSTHPVRGATGGGTLYGKRKTCFNPRTP